MTDRYRRLFGLLITIVFVNALGASPSVFVGADTTWIDRPAFYPPEILFPIVWTILFTLMGVALWRLVRRRNRAGARLALLLFALQFALNLAWTPVFFGLRRPDLAVAVIVALLATLLATIVATRRVDRISAWLLVPYLIWVAFATALTVAIAL